jgi:glycosyltransferase involved in cell wall biosynthesis
MSKDLFFSIIVPAHNEEKYIENTLEHLAALEYPQSFYEVLVMENGSTDSTCALAQKFQQEHPDFNCKVMCLKERGVAFARNRGIESVSPNAEWVIFFDADTIVKRTCLRELATFLSRSSSRQYTLGTGSIKPLPLSIVGRFYFLWQDGLHFLTKTAYGAFFIVRCDILKDHRFDEKLSITEDGEICNAARAKGTFFFMHTNSVSTSTRRFDKLGWLGTLLGSAAIAFMSLEKRRRIEYKVIR